MSYPGNPSLAPDLRQRILTTFEQTLELAAEGSRQEALLGCDFVLRMDPQFQSARLLQDRLRATSGAVQVDDLRPGAAASAPAPADNPFALEDGFDLDLPDLPDSDLLGAAPAFGSKGLRQEYQSLLDQRCFQDLLTRAEGEMQAIAADPELQRIAGAAQERMEAEPYVRKFLTSAREAIRKGETQEAERLLGKARSLDASHPELAELEALQAPPAATPTFAEPAFTLESQEAPFAAQESPFAAPVDLLGGGGMGSTGDSESDRRIRELLDEGQAAFDAGDPQSAIDSWSRIFLIDIDHQEAGRRIEQARKLKAENERQVEETYHDGLAALEGSDLAGARRAFARVLELQPGHVAARDYLQQLDAGTVPVVKPMAPRDLAGVSAEPALPLPSDIQGGPAEELKEEILVPPDPSEVGGRAPARRERETKPAAAPKEKKKASRTFLLVGAPVLLLALVGGWFLWQNWERVFPNSQSEELAAPATTATNPIARATELHRTGKTARAITLLQRTPPNSRYYKDSQTLLAQLQASLKPGAPAQPAGPSSEVLQRRQVLLDAARQSYGERSYLRAVERFERAAALAPLEGTDSESFAHAKGQIEPLVQQIELFKAHDWERILPELWRLREADPGNRDVNRLLVDSYYNLAVRDLQRNDAVKAAEKFQEAAKLDKDDPMLQRHLVFAQTYQERSKDLLYRIYVKYLPLR